MAECQDTFCGQCVECTFERCGQTRIRIIHQLRADCMNTTFQQYMSIPLSWYFTSKDPRVVSSFTRWMVGEEPLPLTDMTKVNDNLYVLKHLPRVKISLKTDEDTGEKIVGLTEHPDPYVTLHIDLQAICFKRMIESNLSDMEKSD